MQRVFRRRVGPVRAWIVAAAAVALTTGALAAAGVQSSYGATAGAAQGSGAHPGSGTRLDHVFIIMLENHAADHVIGDPNAPYITSLASTYGQATNYYGVTHTSEPNYIAATSGNNWWVNNDNGWYPTTANNFGPNQYAHTNIVDELGRRTSRGTPTCRPCPPRVTCPTSGRAAPMRCTRASTTRSSCTTTSG